MDKNTSRKWTLLVASIIFMVMADVAIVFSYSPIAFLIAIIVGVLGMEIYRLR